MTFVDESWLSEEMADEVSEQRSDKVQSAGADVLKLDAGKHRCGCWSHFSATVAALCMSQVAAAAGAALLL
jgi:hypothetical protein